MSFVILEALEDALSIWSEETIIGGHPLQDKFWHVTDHYNVIKQKLLHHTCQQQYVPARVCHTVLNGRSEYTPRANPSQTSILSLIRPAIDPSTNEQYLPKYANTLLYDGPDVPNPALQLPNETVIDVHAIAGYRSLSTSKNKSHKPTKQQPPNEVIPGLGWSLDPDIPPGNCDGTYDAICNRMNTSDCLLSGHMDYKGGLFGDGYSGTFLYFILYLSNSFQAG